MLLAGVGSCFSYAARRAVLESRACGAPSPGIVFVTDLKLPVGNERFGPEVFVSGTVDPPVFGKCGPVQVEVRVDLTRLREGTEGFEWVVEPGRSEVRFALAVSDLSDPGQVRMLQKR
jgi:hypothetical protein